jgi:hypothetical protein
MTNPAGSQQTVRIWDDGGTLGASIQVGRFPPTAATAIITDGNMLVLSLSHESRPGLRENGQPIWAVISLTLNGDTMHIAQMLERSETIKRGTGKKHSLASMLRFADGPFAAAATRVGNGSDVARR